MENAVCLVSHTNAGVGMYRPCQLTRSPISEGHYDASIIAKRDMSILFCGRSW